MTPPGPAAPALVACPDARPPAYQAVVGLARAGLLKRFVTGYYDRGPGFVRKAGRRMAPQRFERWERRLGRRSEPEIPADRVISGVGYDLALRLENRLEGRWKRGVARWRTQRFDRALAGLVRRERPGAALVFSDVGSDLTLPACRALGIPYVLSMVHGDVREERELLRREAEVSPEFFPLYLGDGTLDRSELDRLHDRRLRELDGADVVLVPSDHIADALVARGTPRDKVRVIPYAADTRRFRPGPTRPAGAGCTFLFAGGISGRKGVHYLLRAWRRVRRPGWRLRLVGAPPRDPGALAPWLGLDGVEVLGRVPYPEVPARMAEADVFVFPTLFEGSAVVTYEALACGLPSVVTPSAGSVVRDGIEGLLVAPGSVDDLAGAMERLGTDPALRAAMSAAARARAEAFDWPRYHASVAEAVAGILSGAPAPALAAAGGLA